MRLRRTRGTGLGISASMWGPSLSADGLTLYFSSDATGSGSEDLYRATRSGRGAALSTAEPLDSLNTASGEGSPYVSADELTLYFYSRAAAGRAALAPRAPAGHH